MAPFIWVWLDRDWRRWPFQVKTIPPGASLVAPHPAARNRTLALGHRLGRPDIRVLLQSEVDEIVGLWRLKLRIKGTSCVAEVASTPAPAAAVAGVAGSGTVPDGKQRSDGFRARAAPLDIFAASSLVRDPGAIPGPARKVPVWVRAASARRRRQQALAG